jgi:chromosome segregation ATPase
VPVTAKLSRRFYETFGDEIANELVEWFNQVDATYRADLLQINELNFSRFDAKLEQRLAELDANWDRKLSNKLADLRSEFSGRLADLTAHMERLFERLDSQLRGHSASIEQLDSRTAGLESKIDGLQDRTAKLESKIDRMEERTARLESKIDRLDDRTTKVASRIEESAAETKAELIKWMFVFWAGAVLSLGGLFYGLVR